MENETFKVNDKEKTFLCSSSMASMAVPSSEKYLKASHPLLECRCKIWGPERTVISSSQIPDRSLSMNFHLKEKYPEGAFLSPRFLGFHLGTPPGGEQLALFLRGKKNFVSLGHSH